MPIHTIAYDLEVDSTPIEVVSLTYSDGFKVPISKVRFETDEASVDWLGKDVTLSLTNEDDTEEVFVGYVDDVNQSDFINQYEVTCSNILSRARNHWLVTNSLETFWERSGIQAEDLVEDLLNEAGITDYEGQTSMFTFGTQGPVQFQLLSVMDAIDQLNNILAYSIYMDGSTVKWYQKFPTPGDVASQTLSSFIRIAETIETRNLRNKVVVFGKNGIYAEASAVSPYLPTDFYQTAIVSSELIDTKSMASSSADYNLTLYNKLGRQLRVDIEGNPSLKVMDTVHVTHTPLGIDEKWFVYSINHEFGTTFTTTATLRRQLW